LTLLTDWLREEPTASEDPNVHVIPAAARTGQGQAVCVAVVEVLEDRVEVLDAEEQVAGD
jgi:hypothetical protein